MSADVRITPSRIQVGQNRGARKRLKDGLLERFIGASVQSSSSGELPDAEKLNQAFAGQARYE